MPDFVYDAWIAPLALKLADDRLVLGCPTSFHRDRVRRHHLAALERCWRTACGIAAEEADPETRERLQRLATLPFELLTERDFAETVGREIETQPVRAGRKAMRRVEPVRPVLQAVNAGGARESTAPLARGPEIGAPGARPASPPTSRPPETRSSSPDRPTPVSAPAAPLYAARIAPKRAAQARLRQRDPRGTDASAGGRHDDLAFALDGEAGSAPFSFESFVVGPCNALAREAALALARRRQRSLNLLYVAGGTGLGKTHLARATAAEAKRFRTTGEDRTPGDGARSAHRVLHTTAEQFTSEFVSAMRNGRNDAWARRYRGPIELLIVEDLHFFSGRTKTQLELYHTIQHVLDSGGSVLLTGDRVPRDLAGLDDRLRAQVGRGFVAELAPPDPIVRRHILRAKAAGGGVSLPKDCLDRLVEATGPDQPAGGSVRDVESVLIQVVTTASLLGRPIDAGLVQEAIDLKSGGRPGAAPRRLAVEEIVRIVATFFGKRPEELASRSRRRDVLVPRQLAMALAHRHTDASLGEIGRALGRDHPSVRNAIQRIERQVLEHAPIRYQLEALSERIDRAITGEDEDGEADPSVGACGPRRQEHPPRPDAVASTSMAAGGMAAGGEADETARAEPRASD